MIFMIRLLRAFDGGHFYLLENPAVVQHAIGEALADAVRCDIAEASASPCR
ncbi:MULTISPECIES: hypothetical protein [unclassified Burkholderia]|uniref:hypothetical protein n=1 Tax=unclassified Burkholderia TaxID=2613784 RepID=UPI001424A71C|nr:MULTISPECIES: hypothetical protein [unclassified Burkholderia]